tara:strand:+ start:63 stop:713 length:651 start_codon:yes stop_codon:yes gene_type:complete
MAAATTHTHPDDGYDKLDELVMLLESSEYEGIKEMINSQDCTLTRENAMIAIFHLLFGGYDDTRIFSVLDKKFNFTKGEIKDMLRHALDGGVAEIITFLMSVDDERKLQSDDVIDIFTTFVHEGNYFESDFTLEWCRRNIQDETYIALFHQVKHHDGEFHSSMENLFMLGAQERLPREEVIRRYAEVSSENGFDSPTKEFLIREYGEEYFVPRITQ